MPGLGGVPVLLEDRAPGGLEQRGVLEEEEVGVEDRGAVLARAGGDRVAGGRDLRPDPLERTLQRLPLGLRVARRLGGNLGRRSPEVASGSERSPRRGRQPGERTGLGASPRRHRRRLDCGRVLVEIALGQRLQGGERLARLRAARGDGDLVSPGARRGSRSR